jgi:hypothetical protein
MAAAIPSQIAMLVLPVSNTAASSDTKNGTHPVIPLTQDRTDDERMPRLSFQEAGELSTVSYLVELDLERGEKRDDEKGFTVSRVSYLIKSGPAK